MKKLWEKLLWWRGPDWRAAKAALQILGAAEAAKELGLKIELLFPGEKRMFLVPRDLWQSGCQRSFWTTAVRWEAGRVAVLSPCGEPAEGIFEDNLHGHFAHCPECAKKLGTRFMPRPTGGP